MTQPFTLEQRDASDEKVKAFCQAYANRICDDFPAAEVDYHALGYDSHSKCLTYLITGRYDAGALHEEHLIWVDCYTVLTEKSELYYTKKR